MTTISTMTIVADYLNIQNHKHLVKNAEALCDYHNVPYHNMSFWAYGSDDECGNIVDLFMMHIHKNNCVYIYEYADWTSDMTDQIWNLYEHDNVTPEHTLEQAIENGKIFSRTYPFDSCKICFK